MPERLECEVLQKARYINTLTFNLYLLPCLPATVLYFYRMYVLPVATPTKTTI